MRSPAASFVLRAAALVGAVALIGCARKAKPPACLGTCADATSCRDTCGIMRCPCAQGDVCDSTGACIPCVVGSCTNAPISCFDECGNADSSCHPVCAQPDTCTDNCGVSQSAVCAAHECDPRQPGGCVDTCGLYAVRCCCTPTSCANAQTCSDDCGNFNPSKCQRQVCNGVPCQDSCGEPDSACWTSCADPASCEDDCGNGNPNACSKVECDPRGNGLDTCGAPDDDC
ncbi:MAG TPA: hypothetical protein VGL86_32145 [Polyangia bacterium]